jgi:hypothetical protein
VKFATPFASPDIPASTQVIENTIGLFYSLITGTSALNPIQAFFLLMIRIYLNLKIIYD